MQHYLLRKGNSSLSIKFVNGMKYHEISLTLMEVGNIVDIQKLVTFQHADGAAND